MDTFGITVFRVCAIMTVLLGLWTIMGQRQITEFSPFDFMVSITVGTIAGAAIVDPGVDLVVVLLVILLLGLLEIVVNRLTLKFRTLSHKINLEPVVLIENGNIVEVNLRKVCLSVEVLLEMLRVKDVFDISQVEVAVLEPHGKLSVLKKAEFLPLNANQIQLTNVVSNRILLPVIVEGQLQEQVLKKMGFSPQQIQDFRQQHQAEIDNIFVAFIDKDHKLHITHADTPKSGVFL